MQDPLSGTKAATDFITDLMSAREGEQVELEKAAEASKGLSQDGQRLYDMCVAGHSEAGTDSGIAAKVCRAYAQDFDRQYSGGFDEVLSADAGPVEKTVSVAGMTADLGSPSAELHLTDTGARRKRGQG
jgi:hypothetical protein